MEIQYHEIATKHQQRKAIQQPMEYDDDLVQQLITIINSLFSPLTWILEETLYRRIKKQDKGWIDIDFLNRNPIIKQIFKKNGIPSQTRRKRNILLRAIKNSVLKKKKNFIKRKEYLNVNNQLKKVFYFEKNHSNTPPVFNNGIQKIKDQNQQNSDFNVLTKSNLRSLIEKITQQLMKNEQNVNSGYEQKMQAINPQNESNQIEFYGHLVQNSQQKVRQLNGFSSIQTQKPSQQLQYRWCFVYLPHLHTEKIGLVHNAFKNVFNSKSDFEGISQSCIRIHTLQEMIQQYYPVYEQICKQIGYKKQDVREERLRIRRKQKQKQRIRLLESVDLQKKIDVVNQYHVKLQVQKQRKAYLKKKQAEYERKMRLRQQRKSNKSKNKKDDDDTQKVDILTQKLKKLLGISCEEDKKEKQIPKTQEDLINQNQSKIQEKKVQNMQAERIEQETQQKASKIKIKLPRYYEDEQNIQDDKFAIERKQNNQIYGSFFEDQLQEMLSSSSSEDYELPKKKSSKKKAEPKKKKIVKNYPKDQNGSKKVHKLPAMHQSAQKSRRQNRDSSTGNSNSHSNSAYNLRHKAPAQGSYLKMVQTFEQNHNQGQSQRVRRDRYAQKFQNVIDQAHGVSSSRTLRSVRKYDDQKI